MKTASLDRSQERCQYYTRTGRQCASRVPHPRSSRCSRHAAAEPRDFEDFEATLTRSAGHFLNAQGINYSLASLYKLLASGRISPRRASVLAYISNLLLRTLTAIDKDPCPEAGKDAGTNLDSQNRLPNQPHFDDPWQNPRLQRATYREEQYQVLPLSDSDPHPDVQPHNTAAENSMSPLATTQPAMQSVAAQAVASEILAARAAAAQPASAATPTPETTATPNPQPPENDPQKPPLEKTRPASSTPTPATPPNPPDIPVYGFTPNSAIGMRLAARNSWLPQHLRNPNDPAADFDRITTRRRPGNST